jgi:hypothetical protein
MSRLERIERDIERAQERVAEWQARLKGLDGQRTEAENTEIVAAIRALKMTPAELRAFLRTGTLPEGLQGKAAIAPARFAKKPEPRAAEPVKADPGAGKVEGGRPDLTTPSAPPANTTKESEVKTNES